MEERRSLAEVARRLGVSQSRLRGWERRYGTVRPQRDERGNRLYSEEDVRQLEWLVEQVRAGISPAAAHRLLEESRLSRVGARAFEPELPPEGTRGRAFTLWATGGALPPLILDQLRLAGRFLATFLVVNFVHPEAGPAGAIIHLSVPPTVPERPARRRMVSTIPLSEQGDYAQRWARGETVLVHRDEMPPKLRVRYTGIPVAWSLNIPFFVDGEWVGVVGGVTGEEKPDEQAIGSVEAARDLLVSEFAVAEARRAFATEVSSKTRTLEP